MNLPPHLILLPQYDAAYQLAMQTAGGDHAVRAVMVAQAAQNEGASTHAATEGAGEAGETAHYEMPHELPNIATLIQAAVGNERAEEPGERPEPIHHWFVNPLFSIFYACVIIWLVRKALGKPSVKHPGRWQIAVETLLVGLRNLVLGIIGPAGERYVPYLGSLFLFIWFNNLAVLVPFLKSPTSGLTLTAPLALCTFALVHFESIRHGGIKGWFFHLLGSPDNVVTWIMAPLFLVLHIIGEIAKPCSLALRLFGNITGEDLLLASFLGMGMMITAALWHTPHPIIGVPLHLPFFALVLLFSTIQATLFTMLSAVYISLLLPHEHHGEHDTHDEHMEDRAVPMAL